MTQPKRFQFGRQQDPHEFLNMLFMTFNESADDDTALALKDTFFGELGTKGIIYVNQFGLVYCRYLQLDITVAVGLHINK